MNKCWKNKNKKIYNLNNYNKKIKFKNKKKKN